MKRVYSSICDPGRKVLIQPVIPGGRASSIPPGIEGGFPPGIPAWIGEIPPEIQDRTGGIPPRIPGGIGGIKGGIPPGMFHNPSRDPRWDPARKRRDPNWDERGIPGGIGGIPHLIFTWGAALKCQVQELQRVSISAVEAHDKTQENFYKVKSNTLYRIDVCY